jgi:diketogulonate reductase-like aldo/keto reductase
MFLLETERNGGWRESWRSLQVLIKVSLSKHVHSHQPRCLRVLCVLIKEGVIGSAGVSNFDISELELLNPPPHVVQNWFDPFHQDRDVVKWCAERGIAYVSYSILGGQWEHQDLGGGGRKTNPVFARLGVATFAINFI